MKKLDLWWLIDLLIYSYLIIRGVLGAILYGPNTLLVVGNYCSPIFCYEAWPSTLIIFAGFLFLYMRINPKAAFFLTIFAACLLELVTYAVIAKDLFGINFLADLWLIGLLISSIELRKEKYRLTSTWLLPIYLLVFFSLYFQGYLPHQPVPDVPAESVCEIFILVTTLRIWRLPSTRLSNAEVDRNLTNYELEVNTQD